MKVKLIEVDAKELEEDGIVLAPNFHVIQIIGPDQRDKNKPFYRILVEVR